MDIQAHVESAKEMMQKSGGGEYIPELIVESDSGAMDFYLLDSFPGGETTPTLLKQLYFEQLAHIWKKKHPGDKVKELCFTCETWRVRMEPGEKRDFLFPSQSKKAVECLSVWYLKVANKEQSFYCFEIENRETALSFGPMEQNEEGETIENAIFTAFLAAIKGESYRMGSL